MKKILTDAVAVANATGRTLGFVPRDPDWFLFENSKREPLKCMLEVKLLDSVTFILERKQ